MDKHHLPEAVEKIISRIIEGYSPEKVVVFGSRAWGKASEESDLDILVIKRTEAKRTRRGEELIRAVFPEGYDMPMDILVLTPEEVEALLERGSQFIEKILEDGILVCEME